MSLTSSVGSLLLLSQGSFYSPVWEGCVIPSVFDLKLTRASFKKKSMFFKLNKQKKNVSYNKIKNEDTCFTLNILIFIWNIIILYQLYSKKINIYIFHFCVQENCIKDISAQDLNKKFKNISEKILHCWS